MPNKQVLTVQLILHGENQVAVVATGPDPAKQFTKLRDKQGGVALTITKSSIIVIGRKEDTHVGKEVPDDRRTSP